MKIFSVDTQTMTMFLEIRDRKRFEY